MLQNSLIILWIVVGVVNLSEELQALTVLISCDDVGSRNKTDTSWLAGVAINTRWSKSKTRPLGRSCVDITISHFHHFCITFTPFGVVSPVNLKYPLVNYAREFHSDSRSPENRVSFVRPICWLCSKPPHRAKVTTLKMVLLDVFESRTSSRDQHCRFYLTFGNWVFRFVFLNTQKRMND